MRCDWVTTISNVTWVHPNWKRRQRAVQCLGTLPVPIAGGSQVLELPLRQSTAPAPEHSSTLLPQQTPGVTRDGEQPPAVTDGHDLQLKPRADLQWEELCWTHRSSPFPTPSHSAF